MIKINKLTKVILALLMSLQCFAFAQESTPYSIGKTYKIHSNILNENRSYIVELPDSYGKGEKEYPLLVLLDGEVNYHSHSGIIKHMTQSRQIPEMIIVAIVNVDRVRDFTPTKYLVNLNGSSAVENHKTSGGSAKFLSFIEQELLPTIEKKYRTNAFRTLVGISHGGLLVGSSFLSENTSFNGFVSMDPSFWWDDQFIVKKLKNTELKQIENKRIYVSTADKFENFDRIPHVFKANINSHERFNTELKNKGVSPGNVDLEYFKEENHWTVALLSLYKGMQFIFKDLKMKNIRNSSLEEIEAYYKTNYNSGFTPPENDINAIGYRFIKSDLKKALAFFKLNVKNYPKSSNAYDSLGEAYFLLGKKKEALESYKKSLELDSRNDNARKMIEKISRG
ncbi:alpha/beta hydrolase-fold protein [Pseudotenacibaculum haliotis]|uniref:Alpha/beta hydrolase-fold protein n=1 Tax=Pseudotenacibaculum haliotis TaxID=1862138 RepID=A0ABW5LS20_9FLAO